MSESFASPPLVQRLVDQFAASWVGLDNIDAWLSRPGEALLLLCGDPVRYPESLDVAVVLPELCQVLALRHGCRLRIGVGRRADEEALAERFGQASSGCATADLSPRSTACVTGMSTCAWQKTLCSRAMR